MKKNKYILSAVLLYALGGIHAQTLTQAKQWFADGKYAEAAPVFAKLVKQAPANAAYNFWYGVCCMKTGDPGTARTCLEKSAARKYADAYLYLGRLNYAEYLFDDAADNLEAYIAQLEKKKRDTSDYERELDRYRQAARMIRGTEKVAVIDSFVVNKADFLRAYRLDRSAGSLTQEKNGISTEFTNELGDKKYSALADTNGHIHLYSSTRLIDGWSSPERVKGLDETITQNPNYPFMDSDGITLYFSAQGEESLGGYDIFVTRYDSDEQAFLRPDNIGMPFNSPFNDYMFAIDDLNGLGWFASDRYQPQGKVCIYVFVPNESKQVYDFDNTSPHILQTAASLLSIRSTWTDAAKVRTARQQLAQVMYAESAPREETDFELVIDDHIVYHHWTDFHSKEARNLYQSLLSKTHDLDALQQALDAQRIQYNKANRAQRQQLAPGMLDQEKRILQLQKELQGMAVSVRNTELQKLKQ